MKSVIRTDWSIAFLQKAPGLEQSWSVLPCYWRVCGGGDGGWFGWLVWFFSRLGSSSFQQTECMETLMNHVYTNQHLVKTVLHHPWDSQFLFFKNPSLNSLHAKLDLKPFEMQGRKALLRGISGRGMVAGNFRGVEVEFRLGGFPQE